MYNLLPDNLLSKKSHLIFVIKRQTAEGYQLEHGYQAWMKTMILRKTEGCLRELKMENKHGSMRERLFLTRKPNVHRNK